MRGVVLVLVVGDGDETEGCVAVMMAYIIHQQRPTTSLLSTASLRPILRMTLLCISLSVERCGCFLFSRSLSYSSRVAKPKLHCTSGDNSLLLLPPRALCTSRFFSFTKTKNAQGQQQQQQQQQQYSCSSKALQANVGIKSTDNNTLVSTPSKWNLPTVRQKFIDYFVRLRDHKEVPSSPVIPVNDPTLLFTNSGMNQFKPIFLGRADPKTPLGALRRVVNSQKCIRAGGKHNDLDDVGQDVYHHTFFEMLGTWSFGDYFKPEAIEWAWDLLTSEEHFGLPANRFYVTYFGGDEKLGLPPDMDVRNLWLRFIPEDRILPGTSKDNFWEMGNSGPCGPCSELHFDMVGSGRNVRHLVNADTPEVVEIWNLVFMQYNREEESSGGGLVELPQCHVDTGMGLERLTSILQQTSCSYDTDVFKSLFKFVHQEVKGVGYEGRVGAADTNLKDTAYRIVADHARALTFAITDGVIPSNEGRGYVLRRIFRRAVRYGQQILGAPPGFFSRLVPVVIDTFGDDFPELRKKSDITISLVREEEESFSRMLDRGIKYLTEAASIQKAEGLNHLTGKQAFFLYDSMGFPFDLTEIMGKEMGLAVDREEFDAEMKIQKDRSRQVATNARREASDSSVTHELGPDEILWLRKAGIRGTDDTVKYDPHLPPHGTEVCGILANNKLVRTLPEGCEVFGLVVASTPFYAEAGGQVSDIGVVKSQASGNSAHMNNNILEGTAALDNMDDVMVADVFDVRTYAGYVLHCCKLQNAQATSPLKVGCHVSFQVDAKHRFCVAPNHTMTHVLNAALRDVLGASVEQKGSLVSHDRLRFDFSYSKAIPLHLLKRVEELVQRIISEARPVFTASMSLSEARRIPGLRTVFGEEYPDPVRIISIGSPPSGLVSDGVGELEVQHSDILSSVELCGGTHIENTSEAVAFTILEETAVAKGIRRITAVTGDAAIASLLQGQLMTSELEMLESEVGIMGSSSVSLDAANLEGRKLEEIDPNALKQR